MFGRTPAVIVNEIIETFNKMAFVSGPRQVGKTTLAKNYQKGFGQSLYLNWDTLPTKKKSFPPLFFSKKKTGTPASLS
jgi:predicted AAA+ superfamily ATPase